jgi:hypothetical protein
MRGLARRHVDHGGMGIRDLLGPAGKGACQGRGNECLRPSIDWGSWVGMSGIPVFPDRGIYLHALLQALDHPAELLSL